MNQSAHHPFTVGAFGILTWDQLIRVDPYPRPGSFQVVEEYVEQSGGTTGNMAVALARLGVHVSMASRIGDDSNGQRVLGDLIAEGCDVEYVKTLDNTPTDRSVILVSGAGNERERTILWLQGARLQHGHHLPIESFFARDLVLVDVDDPRLRLFLLDLPMHVSPRTRMFGTLTFLAELAPDHGLELALRHDYLAGSVAELKQITACTSLGAAISRFQQEMILSQVRFAAISDGDRGCIMVTREHAQRIPAYAIDAVDPTGAGDAFAAGVAYGVLNRWDLEHAGRFANAIGALATRALGARAALPDLQSVEQFMNSTPTRQINADSPYGD